MKDIIIHSLLWKLLERFSVQGSQFLIQIILSRLLSPDNYGALAIMMIFVAMANVIIQNGFATALVQNKNTDDIDFSSVFWTVLLMSLFIYFFMFLSIPYIVLYYNMQYLEYPFKTICLMLIPGSLNSVQLAIIRRNMEFKIEFTSNIVSILISGVIGIMCAYNGFGLWALVIQTLLNTTISCFTMWRIVKWRPRFVYNIDRVLLLFSFGYKLVFAGLLETISLNLSGFIIGAKYSTTALGFYTRGNQFPNALMSILNSSVQSVLLPALSALQDNKQKAKLLMRQSIILSSFIVFPMMACLAGISRPMVVLLLTNKWIECVPYIQIFCFTYAFWPIHTSNLQAINAMGRSDIYLRLEVYKKIVGWAALILSLCFFDNPIAIAAVGMLTGLISCFINCYPNKFLLGYSYNEQMKDIFPYFSISFAMYILILTIVPIFNNIIISITVSSMLGIIFYLSFSYIFKLEAYFILHNKIKHIE